LQTPPDFLLVKHRQPIWGVDANNVLYVIYDDQGDGDNSYLKSWNGDAWETISS
jgi:hypothetical protein